MEDGSIRLGKNILYLLLLIELFYFYLYLGDFCIMKELTEKDFKRNDGIKFILFFFYY